MFQLRKNKPEAAAVAVSGWHPNFRDFERLPDTKVVRTAFFINGIPVAIALAAVLWFGANEYRLHDLNRQIEEVQAEIDRTAPASTRAKALYKNFQAEGARITEVDTFVKSRPVVSELLMVLAATLPANIALDGFDLNETFVTLRGTVRGAPDQASGYASTYLQQLKADPTLSPMFDDIKLVNLARNPATGRLNLEISMHLVPSLAGGKK